jgi:uncharacterized protein
MSRCKRKITYLHVMITKSFKVFVSEKLGEISAEAYEPEDAKVMMTLGHGAGAGMDHAFMKKLAAELADCNIATVRYNLHYMEHGKKRPDMPAVAHSVIRAVMEKTASLYPSLPLIGAGKSFGGRMTSQLISRGDMPNVKGLIFYGFPLHPANAPSIDRAEHLYSIELPMLFLQGTKDALADLSLLKGVLHHIPRATLEIIENADHSFKIGKKEAIVDLSKKTENWLRKLNIL